MEIKTAHEFRPIKMEEAGEYKHIIRNVENFLLDGHIQISSCRWHYYNLVLFLSNFKWEVLGSTFVNEISMLNYYGCLLCGLAQIPTS